MTNPSTDIEPNAPRTFIVAHDLSSFAEEAADTALDDLLDSRRGGRIVLLHAVELFLPPAAMDFGAIAPSYATIEQEARVLAVRAMERIAERLRQRQKLVYVGPPPVEIEPVVCSGRPAEVVIEEAAARRAARIYVGTHGRGALTRLMIGSVAERIARRASVPVVVVHGTRADAPSLEQAA